MDAVKLLSRGNSPKCLLVYWISNSTLTLEFAVLVLEVGMEEPAVSSSTVPVSNTEGTQVGAWKGAGESRAGKGNGKGETGRGTQ